MKNTRTTELFTLPPRKSDQTLRGFVRVHVKLFEHLLDAGVSYASLAKAVRAAGFGERSVVSLRVAIFKARKRALECAGAQVAQPSAPLTAQSSSEAPGRIGAFENSISPRSPSEESAPRRLTRDSPADIARRLRELARPPRPGEKDPLD